MDDATLTFIVLGATVALFVWNRLPVAIVAMASALALYATGVISAEQAFAGFGDPTVIFIASLFVLSEALDVSARPVLMTLAVACAAAYLTPISTPGNLMIMGPGGYRFGDYWRFGLVMLALSFVIAVFWVPVVWRF
jgi:di/tricarboxylate transporter